MAGPIAITSTSSWIRCTVELFAALGAQPLPLLRAAGIDPETLKQSHIRIGTEQVSRLWEAAVAATGQAALGLDRELAARSMNFDMPAQAMRPSPHLRAGLEGLARYLELIGDGAGIRLEHELGGTWLTMIHSTEGWPRQRAEFGLLGMLVLCSRVTGRALKPRQAEFSNPDPVDFHPYRLAFGCPLRFGQPADRLLFDEADMMRPLSAGPSVSVSQERVLERRLARSARRMVSFRVAEQLARQLHVGVPTAARVARALEMTEAELARRLKAEGTGYDRLLDEVRKELAAEYLGDPNHLLERIPALLGYTTNEDLAAACKRWFSLSPAQFRQLARDRATS